MNNLKKILFITLMFSLGLNQVTAFGFNINTDDLIDVYNDYFSIMQDPSRELSDEGCYNLNGNCINGNCANGNCEFEQGENSENCPSDCGSFCSYDGKCDLTDDESICVSDCTICNYNEICEITENENTCAFDCFQLTGVITSVSNTILTDATASYFINKFEDKTLIMMSGNKEGESKTIISNTENNIVTASWPGRNVGDAFFVEENTCNLNENYVSDPVNCLCQRDYCNVLGAYAECFGTCNDFFGGRAVVKRIETFNIDGLELEEVVVRLQDNFLSLKIDESTQEIIPNSFVVEFPEIITSLSQNIFSAKMKIKLSKSLEENQKIEILFSKEPNKLEINTCTNNDCCQSSDHFFFDGTHRDSHYSIKRHKFNEDNQDLEIGNNDLAEVGNAILIDEFCVSSTSGVEQEITIPFTDLLEETMVENSFTIDFSDVGGSNVITFNELMIEVTKPFEDINEYKLLETPISFGFGLKSNVQTDADSCQIIGEQCDTSTTCGCDHYFNEELPNSLCNVSRTSKLPVIFTKEGNVYHYLPEDGENNILGNYDLKTDTDLTSYAYRITSDSFYIIKTYNIEQHLISSNFISETDEDYEKLLEEDDVRLRLGSV